MARVGLGVGSGVGAGVMPGNGAAVGSGVPGDGAADGISEMGLQYSSSGSCRSSWLFQKWRLDKMFYPSDTKPEEAALTNRTQPAYWPGINTG